ncbi:MAG: electron transfer flavoprotein subunit beta/FixA family protein [Desulfohalobiaceae bacterium]|nr:electron transfer flavoprotein subunit beta/FixA family protein [Desulfohalobiaceae bacterium]
MHIVCCLKQVPDTADVKIDPETNTLIREGVESISNPYDLVALEQAVRIREKYGGMVSAVSMGPPQARAVLREALAQGADQAFLLSDRAFAGADTLATSYTLAQSILALDRQMPVRLVFCGKQAIDGDTAQTGPGIATRLGYSQFTYVLGVDRIDPDMGEIQVRRKVESGQEVLRGPLPALLTVELELAEPRRASLPGLMASLRQEVPAWDSRAIEAEADQLGLKGSPTWVKKIGAPPARASGPSFNASSEPGQAVSDALETLLNDADFAADLNLQP